MWLVKSKKVNPFGNGLQLMLPLVHSLISLPKREHAQFKQRWEKMNEIVNKFVGCYATATNQKAMKMAKQLYQYDKKKKFTMDHA